VWVYYSAQILLLGAEVTHVYANKHGSRAGFPQRDCALRSEDVSSLRQDSTFRSSYQSHTGGPLRKLQ
jgi:uncharacterized BrkB/YihY/UPF0761 family membrane protein